MVTLPAFLFTFALLASLTLPVRFEFACLIVVAAGLAKIGVCDYTRTMRALLVRAVPLTLSRKERLGLAA